MNLKKALLKKLLKERKNRVYSYACMMLRNREDAEDVTQDVFVRLWQNWDSVESKKRKAWLIRVTHNRCIDLIRNKKAAIVQQRMNTDVDMDSMPAKDYNGPDTNMEEKEVQENLMKALNQLQETTRSMILLHYYQGMTFNTIGDILEINPNTSEGCCASWAETAQRNFVRKKLNTIKRFWIMSSTCHDMNTLIKDFFDGRLRRRDRSRLFSHLKRCTTCRDAFEKEKEVIRQIRGLPVSQCPDFVIKSIEASTILKEKSRRRKERKYEQWSFVWKPAAAGVLVIGLILLFVIKPFDTIKETAPITYTQEEIEKAREQAKYSLALVANTLKEEQEHAIKDVVFKNISQTIRKSVSIAIPILGGDEK